MSNFFEDHPGGGEVLKDVAGTDSTKDFDYVDHSDDAWRTMEKIQVGILDGWVEVRYHAIGMPILSPGQTNA